MLTDANNTQFRAGVNAVVAATRVGRYFGARRDLVVPTVPKQDTSGEVEAGVREANRRLLQAIVERDWET